MLSGLEPHQEVTSCRPINYNLYRVMEVGMGLAMASTFLRHHAAASRAANDVGLPSFTFVLRSKSVQGFSARFRSPALMICSNHATSIIVVLPNDLPDRRKTNQLPYQTASSYFV